MSIGSNFIRQELNLTESGSIIHEMGSFASNLGFSQHTIGGTRNVVFANRVLGAGAGGRWLGVSQEFGKATFGTMTQAMEYGNITTTGVKGAANKALFGTGLRGASFGYTANLLFTASQGIGSYRESRRRGNGVLTSAALGIGGAAKIMVQQKLIATAIKNPYVAGGLALVGGAYMLGSQTVKSIEMGNQYLKSRTRNNFNQPSMSMYNQNAFTMRQRALVSMEHSKFNSMKALGGEGMFRHMPKARYGNSDYGLSPSPILGY